MADAKITMTDADPADFIASIKPASKREDAEVLDALFRRVTGEEPVMWGDALIGYGEYRTTYASGRKVHWLRTGFSPRKARLSLHLMGGYSDKAAGERRDALLAKLGKHKTGASCVYINKLTDVDMDELEEILRNDWDAMNRTYPDS